MFSFKIQISQSGDSSRFIDFTGASIFIIKITGNSWICSLTTISISSKKCPKKYRKKCPILSRKCQPTNTLWKIETQRAHK